MGSGNIDESAGKAGVQELRSTYSKAVSRALMTLKTHWLEDSMIRHRMSGPDHRFASEDRPNSRNKSFQSKPPLLCTISKYQRSSTTTQLNLRMRRASLNTLCHSSFCFVRTRPFDAMDFQRSGKFLQRHSMIQRSHSENRNDYHSTHKEARLGMKPKIVRVRHELPLAFVYGRLWKTNSFHLASPSILLRWKDKSRFQKHCAYVGNVHGLG